jgi:2-amino-4-hydroxy-6-hydroxymethyldihydropteridine diphosphokinase
MKYFVSLGTNLGDRARHLKQSRLLLEKAGARILRQSSVYETEPVDYQNQPGFYNQVQEVEIACNPISFLDLIKDVEQKMRRRPSFDKGPRVIDY